MDVYHRGCETLENFSVGATGGISRRHGMRHICKAMPGGSVLIPFTYSQNLSYLIELGPSTIVVRNTSNFDIVAQFESDGQWFYEDLQTVRTYQLNAWLIIVAPSSPIMKLVLEADYSWQLSLFKFKTPPWESIDYADSEASITPIAPFTGTYKISFEDSSTTLLPGDILRFSYFTPRQQASASSAELLGGEWRIFGADRTAVQPAITHESTFHPGEKLACAGEPMLEYFVCTRTEDAWQGARDFVPGLTSPANYAEDFARAGDIESFEDVEPIYGLTAQSTFARGAKIKLYSGYWNLFTCIRPFTSADYKEGKNSPSDYPSHFISGLPVGDALMCQGSWKFNCSGTWCGRYEIRKSSSSPDLSADWQTLGESFSPIGGPTNNVITGSEENEECFLRLFLTASQFKSQHISAGFPADECSNSLIVNSFKRNITFTAAADSYVTDNNPAFSPNMSLSSADWSMAAFNSRYGYPSIIGLHNNRLVLAGTRHQPQTLWFSQIDDLNNFAVSSSDSSALHLTMNTETQEPICWLASRSDVLMLGTQDAEWTISGGNTGNLTAENASVRNYGHRGAAPVPALRAEDRILYCERGAARVLEYSYQDEYAAYVSSDTTIFASHIARQGGGIISGALLRKPDTIAVFLLADGSLAAMTYNTMHNVNAWHRFTTQGSVESICALPNGTKSDRLFLIVSRNGTRRIELMDEDSAFTDGKEAFEYTSTVTTTAFLTPEQDAAKGLHPSVSAFFDSGTPMEAIRVATSGQLVPISHVGKTVRGWLKLCSLTHWDDSPTVTISISGPHAATLQAIQLN